MSTLPLSAMKALFLLITCGLVLLCGADEVHRIPDVCEETTSFPCDDTQCIDEDKKCNGISECRNGRDESVAVCGCQPVEFKCNDTVCIDLIKRCDRNMDCVNNLDETGCETHLCPPTHIRCRNYFCIPRGMQCDFKDDCGDNSDEESCPHQTCYPSQWTCDNGQCITNSDLCDGQLDCHDGSDEKNCDHHVQCANGLYVSRDHYCDGWVDCYLTQEDEIGCPCNQSNGQFLCPNRRCIRDANVCDGDCDCGDTCEDELLCGEVPCLAPGRFICQKTYKCLRPEYVCDGVNDCRDSDVGHDEEHCLAPEQVCTSGVYCDGKCLITEPQKVPEICDYTPDCIHREDEQNQNCEFPACPPDNHYRCKNSQCIPYSMACDTVINCLDMSDETRCENHRCEAGSFRCAVSGQCIDQHRVCDFHKDCMDGSDEANCNMPVCRPDQFRCKSGQCIPLASICIHTVEQHSNMTQSCADSSHLINCKDFECPANYFKCRNSYCIGMQYVCDGYPDCGATITDEASCSRDCPDDPGEERGTNVSVPKKLKCKCFDFEMNCERIGFYQIPDMSQDPFSTSTLNLFTSDTPDMSHKPLSTLRFGGNYLNETLSQETFLPLSHFTYLDLSNNSISHLGAGYFNRLWLLSTLNIADNNITTIENGTFLGLGRLQTLYLHNNGIKQLNSYSFLGLSSLTVLDLSHQDIEIIPKNAFTGLRSLHNLDISYNQITTIHEGAFIGLERLIMLDISHNEIHSVGDNTFNGLPSLETLKTDEFRFCCLAPSVDDCTPEPDEFSSCEDLMSNFVLRICIWVLGLMSLLGNMLVIYWRMRDTRDSKVHSFLITNLAIGDLLMGVYLLIIASVDLRYRGVYIVYDLLWRHSGLCKFAGFLSTYSSELSVVTLTVITIDRFISIIFPFRIKRLSMRDARVVMVTLWGLVFALAAIPLTDIQYFQNFYGRSGVCLALHITPEKPNGWEYSVFVFLAWNFMSFLVIFLSYMWMFFVARRTRAAVRSPQMKTDRAMARRMTLIVLTDFFCWIPIIGLGVASLCGANIPQQVFAWIAVFVLPLNSAINPLLYTLSTASFLGHAKRRAFKFRKSFMSSFSPTDNTKTTVVSAGEYRGSAAVQEWKRPFYKSPKQYRCPEAMFMYPINTASNKLNGGYQGTSHRHDNRKIIRTDSSTSAEYTRTDVICGYESDQ